MKAKEIIDLLHATPVVISHDDFDEKEYQYGFATDLMSDALAMIQSSFDQTVILTGLANVQSLNTADMLDVSFVILVRGKSIPDEILHICEAKGINLVMTNLTMFEACGILYQNGMESINVKSIA